jgi:NADPH-dependent F420 reductase
MCIMRIAIIGGTGPQGKGLGYRFALAGHEVVIGSRTQERAEAAAQEIAARGEGLAVRGATNDAVAREDAIIILTIPYEGQAEFLPPFADAVAGKTVVVTDVPLAFENGQPTMLAVPQGSAAEQAQALLPGAKVAGAFQNLAAGKLWKKDDALDQDVIVCADDAGARQDVMALAEQIRGVRAVDGGPLAAARYVEGITVLLIGINKRYKTNAGVRVAGV